MAPVPEDAHHEGAGQAAASVGRPRDRMARRGHATKRTRFGQAWVAAVLFAVVLLLLLIFILENGQQVSIGYFGAHGHLPLGVALLLAAVFGVLLVVIPGTARIIQLRTTVRRHRRLYPDAAAPPFPDANSSPPGPSAGSSQS